MLESWAEGLGNRSVPCLRVLHGVLWAGTENGLWAHDGARWVERAEVSSHQVRVLGDHHGELVVGTDRALFVGQGERLVPVTLEGEPFEVWGASSVGDAPVGLLVVSRGRLLLAEPTATGWAARPYLAAELPRVWGLLPTAKGVVVGCDRGLCRVDGTTVRRWGASEGLPPDAYGGFVFDGVRVWARGGAHLVTLEADGAIVDRTPPRFRSDNSPAMVVDAAGRVVVAVDERLLRWGGHWEVLDQRSGLPDEILSALCFDDGGNLWLGAFGLGVFRWAGASEWSSWTRAEGLESGSVWALARGPAGRLLVGHDLGLAALDDDGGLAALHFDGGAEGSVRGLLTARDGALWYATREAIVRVTPDGVAATAPLDGPLGFVEAPDGGIFIASSTGHRRVASMAPLRTEPLSALARGGHVLAVCGAALVAATTEGVSVDRGAGWTRALTTADLGGEVLAAACVDGDWWLGGSFGLAHVVDDGVAARVVERVTRPTLPSNLVVALVRRGRELWAGLDVGLAHFDGAHWTLNTEQEGLTRNDVDSNALLLEGDGTLWVGTSGGLSRWRPHPTAPPPQPRLRVAHAGRAVGVDATLAWAEGELTVDVSPGVFSRALEYRYMLVGLDDRWHSSKEGQRVWAQLPPGTYTLMVTARDAHLDRQGPPAAVAFELRAPWWRTPPALVLALAGLVGLGALGGWVRVRWLMVEQARLERLVAQRTLELRAEVEAEAAARARAQHERALRGEFLAHVSHELRNPLAGILGASQLLAQGLAPGEQRRDAQLIVDSSQTMLLLLGQLLDFAKIDAGKFVLERVEFELQPTLTRVTDLARRSKPGAAVEVRLEVDPQVPRYVVGDALRLGQVLLNLLSNAVKFTDAGLVSLSVEARPANALRFEVRDTGVGMGEEVLRRLFQRFEQAAPSTSRTHGGTGLGLSIARTLVQAMGGDIEVRSAPGHGTTMRFELTLPRPESKP